MSEMTGRNVLITGANTGIGRATAVELAERGASVWLACRSLERTQPALDEIKAKTGKDARFLPLDLGSFDSIRACAKAYLDTGEPLHVLLNNAGMAAHDGVTSDGFEITFGVNHLGHFLLTMLLLDRLRESSPARIVNVSSQGHYMARSIDYDAMRTTKSSLMGLDIYNQSKLANVLFSAELARRLEGSGITTYSLHPGVVASDVWRKVPWPVRPLMTWFMISNQKGAETSLHCACDDGAATETGLYYDRSKPKTPSREAQDPKLAAELWRRSVEWTGEDATGS